MMGGGVLCTCGESLSYLPIDGSTYVTRSEPFPAAYFRGRPLDLLRCSLAQASTSGRSHNLGRPGPRSITGRGISGYLRR